MEACKYHLKPVEIVTGAGRGQTTAEATVEIDTSIYGEPHVLQVTGAAEKLLQRVKRTVRETPTCAYSSRLLSATTPEPSQDDRHTTGHPEHGQTRGRVLIRAIWYCDYCAGKASAEKAKPAPSAVAVEKWRPKRGDEMFHLYKGLGVVEHGDDYYNNTDVDVRFVGGKRAMRTAADLLQPQFQKNDALKDELGRTVMFEGYAPPSGLECVVRFGNGEKSVAVTRNLRRPGTLAHGFGRCPSFDEEMDALRKPKSAAAIVTKGVPYTAERRPMIGDVVRVNIDHETPEATITEVFDDPMGRNSMGYVETRLNKSSNYGAMRWKESLMTVKLLRRRDARAYGF
jgi:hypothetical protein